MTATSEHIETFEVIDDLLIRKVVPRRGQPYEHRCPKASFETVAFEIDELDGSGFSIEDLASRVETALGEHIP